MIHFHDFFDFLLAVNAQTVNDGVSLGERRKGAVIKGATVFDGFFAVFTVLGLHVHIEGLFLQETLGTNGATVVQLVFVRKLMVTHGVLATLYHAAINTDKFSVGVLFVFHEIRCCVC